MATIVVPAGPGGRTGRDQRIAVPPRMREECWMLDTFRIVDFSTVYDSNYMKIDGLAGITANSGYGCRGADHGWSHRLGIRRRGDSDELEFGSYDYFVGSGDGSDRWCGSLRYWRDGSRLRLPDRRAPRFQRAVHIRMNDPRQENGMIEEFVRIKEGRRYGEWVRVFKDRRVQWTTHGSPTIDFVWLSAWAKNLEAPAVYKHSFKGLSIGDPR